MSDLHAAINRLKQGGMVIVVDDEERENEGDLVMLASCVRPEDINFMASHGRGLICQAITSTRARELELHPMVSENTAALSTAFTVSVDARNRTSTGISASDRAATVAAITDPQSTPADFLRPGHVFPLVAHDEGLFGRNGHTEAAIDLARMAGQYPSAVICEIMDDDGEMARRPRLEKLAADWGLCMINVQDIINWRRIEKTRYRHRPRILSGRQQLGNHNVDSTYGVKRISEAHMPTSHGDFRIISYEPECFALIKGERLTAPLVRIHSECLTGEALGSLRCDCGFQLHRAMDLIEEEGSGVIVYLRQEGRGIGLLNKLRAYALQDEGLDSYEANLALHLPADSRDYSLAAAVLSNLGIKHCRLLTNNPDKIRALSAIKVTQLNLEAGLNKYNRRYLETKKERFGHLLLFDKEENLIEEETNDSFH